MSIKNYFTKKQNTYLKVLQLRYCGRDSIIQVRNRPYFHYGPFGRTKNKMEVVQTYKTSCRYVTYNDGDEEHYIFHCTIDKLVNIRKDFLKKLHESNLQSCFNDVAFSELTRMILKGTCRMKLDKIGKFLSVIDDYRIAF